MFRSDLGEMDAWDFRIENARQRPALIGYFATEKKVMGEHDVKYVCVAKTKCAFASVSLSSAWRHETPSHLLFHSFGIQFISPVTNCFLFFFSSLQPTPPFTSSAAHYLPPSFSVTLSWREKWWDGGIRGSGRGEFSLNNFVLALKKLTI